MFCVEQPALSTRSQSAILTLAHDWPTKGNKTPTQVVWPAASSAKRHLHAVSSRSTSEPHKPVCGDKKSGDHKGVPHQKRHWLVTLELHLMPTSWAVVSISVTTSTRKYRQRATQNPLIDSANASIRYQSMHLNTKNSIGASGKINRMSRIRQILVV